MISKRIFITVVNYTDISFCRLDRCEIISSGSFMIAEVFLEFSKIFQRNFNIQKFVIFQVQNLTNC